MTFSRARFYGEEKRIFCAVKANMGVTTVLHPAAEVSGASISRLQHIRRKASPLVPSLLVLAGTLACTWISFRLGLDLATVGFFYLVCVVLAATYGGFFHATFISVVSVACLDYFFSEPVFSLTVNRLSDWVELGAFEFTALVISQLSNLAHLREREAVAERLETKRLYETARRILLSNSVDPGNEVASLVRQTFGLRCAVLFDAVSVKLYESGESSSEILRRTQDAYALDADAFDSERKNCFCVLRLGVRAVGAIALCGTGMKPLTASALASLAAIALERSRTLEKQCQAEAARQAEQLRTAVLDALAHKFKTPLTVIRTANSGLPAAGNLSEVQRDLVSMIDQEARKLNDLASRLVSSPALDFKEFEPQLEPLLLSRLVKAAVQEIAHASDRERFKIVAPESEVPVFADRELILTALAQLVDNALKYSAPESPIDVALNVRPKAVTLKMRSKGLVVSAQDSQRIFERFYRTTAAQSCTGGSGLGLSIVKSIAADHHGHVWAEGEPNYGTTFWFSLPAMAEGTAA